MLNTDIQETTIQEDASKLQQGWRKVRFGDVVRNVDINERNPLTNGIDRYVGLEHIDPASIHITRWGNIEDGTSFTRKFVAGQVLFGKRRAYQGKVALAEFDGICSGDILVFEAKDDLIPGLLPFIVQSEGFYKHALNTSAGSLSPRTKWKDLATYEFALPPKDEQQRIAEILWAADESIRRFEEVRDKQINLKDRLFDAILTGSNIFSERKDCVYGSVPYYWNIVRLEDLVSFKNGINKSKEDFGSGTQFVNISDVFTERLDILHLGRVNVSINEIKDYKLQDGDILIVRSSVKPEGVGYPTMYMGSDNPIVFSGFTIRLRPLQNVIYPPFLLHHMRWQLFRNKLLSNSTVSANTNINQKALSTLMIIQPQLDEQIKIAHALDTMVDKILETLRHLEVIRNFKKHLIKQLIAVI